MKRQYIRRRQLLSDESLMTDIMLKTSHGRFRFEIHHFFACFLWTWNEIYFAFVILCKLQYVQLSRLRDRWPTVGQYLPLQMNQQMHFYFRYPIRFSIVCSLKFWTLRFFPRQQIASMLKCRLLKSVESFLTASRVKMNVKYSFDYFVFFLR